MLLQDAPGPSLIGRGTARATAIGEGKEVLLRHHLGLRVMGNKHRLDLLVLQAQKAHHPEEKALGDILFARGHRAAAVHEHVDRGIGVPFLVLVPDLVAQVVVVQVADFGDAPGRVALEILQQGAALVEVGQGAAAAHVGKAVRGRGDLPFRLFFQPGQGQIFEHHLRQFFQRHLHFIGVLAWLVPRHDRRPGSLPSPLRRPSTSPGWPCALPHALLGLAVLKAVLIEIAQRNLHPLAAHPR